MRAHRADDAQRRCGDPPLCVRRSQRCHRACCRRHTTMFSSRPGTKITFFGSPVTNRAIAGAASAASSASSFVTSPAHANRSAHLAVHLHGDLDQLLARPASASYAGQPESNTLSLVAELLPQLLGDVRRERRDELHQRLDLVAMRRALALPHDVHVLHHRRDRRVVARAAGCRRPPSDRLVQLAHARRGSGAPSRRRLVHRRPQPVEEAPHAGDATGRGSRRPPRTDRGT